MTRQKVTGNIIAVKTPKGKCILKKRAIGNATSATAASPNLLFSSDLPQTHWISTAAT
jgi:hypothetical protein